MRDSLGLEKVGLHFQNGFEVVHHSLLACLDLLTDAQQYRNGYHFKCVFKYSMAFILSGKDDFFVILFSEKICKTDTIPEFCSISF